ncbi:MAG: hypothetical protein ACXU9L_04560 [Thermodesulfobacteriota bacterium]
MKTKRSFSPVYLGILSGVILVILIINGLLEINRTKNGFYLLLKREGTVLIQHFQKNIQETLASLQGTESGAEKHPLNPPMSGLYFGLEDSIAEYLLEIVYRVDQIDGEKPLNSSDFQSLVEQYRITSIEIYDSNGNLLKGGPSPFFSPETKNLLQ